MRKSIFALLLAMALIPMVNVGCQTESNSSPVSQSNDVTVSESLLRFADVMGFKYMEVLNRAKVGDFDALRKMYDFHGTADDMDGVNHGVTCLELIPVAGDEACAIATKNLKPALKTLLISRYEQGQSYTKKEELKKPMEQWAPMSWAALHGTVVPGLCDMTKETPMRKPGADQQPALGSDAAPAGGLGGRPGGLAPASAPAAGGRKE